MRSIIQLAATFDFQSYFDNTLQENAILSQTPGNPIVDSTRQFAQVEGVGVALHPCSQSPVAIKFQGTNSSNSAVVHLTPGQRMITGPFRSFEWGLPFGWLGGGPVILYVLGAEDVDVSFPSTSSPIIFHRLRVIVENGAAGPIAVPTGAAINWPLSFPWSNAIRGVVAGIGPTPQQAAPLFQVIPDIVFLQYRGALAAPLDLVIQFSNTDPFELRSPPDQAVGYSNGFHLFPITFPAVPAPLGPLAAPIWLDREIARLAGTAAEFHLVDPTNTVTGQFVDVVRYGRFM